MNYYSVINKINAGLLLIIFCFSITPRIVLHDCFAGHTDGAGKVKADGQQHIHNVNYKCNCDNFVIQSPFTLTENPSGSTSLQYDIVKPESITRFFLTVEYFSCTERGPPVFI